ncbi:MAG: hypothetical protein GC160_04655 [Acidobacteria bacterium]|nr:hypothetical protein [Acidobacteriota bacterium]
MATDNPELYTIYVGVKRVDSPNTGKRLSAAVTFEITRQFLMEKSIPRLAPDPQNLVVRPGDEVEFEFGKFEVESSNPTLAVTWKALTGKEWAEAPRTVGKRGQIPPKSGYAGQMYAFNAEVDLGVNIHMPAQTLSRQATTTVGVDPEVIVDEC